MEAATVPTGALRRVFFPKQQQVTDHLVPDINQYSRIEDIVGTLAEAHLRNLISEPIGGTGGSDS